MEVNDKGGVQVDFDNVILEKQDRVGILIINRPKALNALNKDTLLDIKSAVEAVRDDEDIDVLIITGSGGQIFCSRSRYQLYAGY